MSMVWSLLLVLALTALGWLLARRTAWGRQLGMTMVVLLLGLLVSNLAGVQLQAEAASWVNGPLTSLAIGLLLLAVDLRRLWPQARQLLGPFLVAALSTVLGVLLGGWLLHPLLGEDWDVLAGMYTATFTGGSLNFVSVARTLNPPETLLTLATAADYVVFAVWFAISTWLGLRADAAPEATWANEAPSDQPERSWWLAGLWGLAVLALSQGLTGLLQGVPSILVLTTVALLVAQLPAPASRRGCYGLGLLLIQPFFTVMGLSSPVAGLLGEFTGVLDQVAIVRGQHAAARGGDDLVAVEGIDGGPGAVAGVAAIVEARAHGLGGVADQRRIIGVADGADAGKIAGVAVEVGRDHRRDGTTLTAAGLQFLLQ